MRRDNLVLLRIMFFDQQGFPLNNVLMLLGFVQFIESTPVAEVLDKDVDGSIQVEFNTRYTVIQLKIIPRVHVGYKMVDSKRGT